MHQFGNSGATDEKEMENINFRLSGKLVCEDCKCIIYGISDWRYQQIKNFYTVNIVFCLHTVTMLKSFLYWSYNIKINKSAYQDDNDDY